MKVSIHRETRDLKIPFRIANAEWTDIDCLTVEVEADGSTGRGEAQGIFFLGETIDTICEQIESVRPEVERGTSVDELQAILP
ncbi:MAG: dipeptide epimerase, partial [Pseudomonadota bacterium]